MWDLDHEESLVSKNWCFQTVVLKKTLENPLDSKEIKPVYLKGNQCWIFIGRTGVEAEAPILWPPHVKSWLIGKHPDAEKDWGQEEKGQHRMRWLDSITDQMDMSLSKLQICDEQGSLVCCSPRGHKELDRTETEQQQCTDVWVGLFRRLSDKELMFSNWRAE